LSGLHYTPVYHIYVAWGGVGDKFVCQQHSVHLFRPTLPTTKDAMTFRLLAPLRDFTEEEAREHLNFLWRGYDWETIVSIVSAKEKARRAAAQSGSASGHGRDPEVK
jgi:hypothetical protein